MCGSVNYYLCISKHPNYTRGAGTYPNNIALVKLTGHAPQKNLIAMATSGDFSGQTCTVSGWGRTSDYNNNNYII